MQWCWRRAERCVGLRWCPEVVPGPWRSGDGA